MPPAARNMIGIVPADDRVEVAVPGRSLDVAIPDELNWSDSESVGHHLRDAWREVGITARHAVVGVPARWLTVRSIVLPPAADDDLREMVRLRIESEFASDARELYADYLVGGRVEGGVTVLIAAAMRRRIDDVCAALRAAGVKVDAVVPAALHLPDLGANESDSVLAYLGPSGAEMLIRRDGMPEVIRHVSYQIEESDDSALLIAGTLRRAILSADVSDLPLKTWHAAGAIDGLEQALQNAVEEDVTFQSVEPGTLARAVGQRSRGGHSLELVHSKLEVRSDRGGARRRRLIGLGIAAAVALVGFVGLDWWQRRAEIAELETTLATIEPDLADARSLISRVREASDWFQRQPTSLDCLLRITSAFPQKGTIWATGISIRPGRRSLLSGQAEDRDAVLAVLERLRSTAGLVSVRMQYLRSAGVAKAPDRVAFSISFEHAPDSPALGATSDSQEPQQASQAPQASQKVSMRTEGDV